MPKYSNHFSLYKNCNSVFIFKYDKNTNKYKIVNKIRNGRNHFVKNYDCSIKKKDLTRFVSNMVYH